MFETILNFFTTSVEYQNWGWNASTFWALGINAFTAIEWWGLQQQNKKIWKERSGESLSVTLFSYVLFAFLAFIFYGVAINSISSVINGLVLGVMYIFVVSGLWRFKKWSVREKTQFWTFASILPAMAFLPWYNEMFLLISVDMMVAGATMPWELWKAGKRGVLEIRLLVTYLASTIFWVGYAFDIEQWVLEILACANLFFLGITTILWCWYYRNEKRAR